MDHCPPKPPGIIGIAWPETASSRRKILRFRGEAHVIPGAIAPESYRRSAPIVSAESIPGQQSEPILWIDNEHRTCNIPGMIPLPPCADIRTWRECAEDCVLSAPGSNPYQHHPASCFSLSRSISANARVSAFRIFFMIASAYSLFSTVCEAIQSCGITRR